MVVSLIGMNNNMRIFAIIFVVVSGIITIISFIPCDNIIPEGFVICNKDGKYTQYRNVEYVGTNGRSALYFVSKGHRYIVSLDNCTYIR